MGVALLRLRELLAEFQARREAALGQANLAHGAIQVLEQLIAELTTPSDLPKE